MRNTLLLVVAVLLAANLLISLRPTPAVAESPRQYMALTFTDLQMKTKIYKGDLFFDKTVSGGLTAYAAEGWTYQGTVFSGNDTLFVFYR